MKEEEEVIKLNKFDEFLIMFLVYNTGLRILGFPEDYSIPQFESKMYAVLFVNAIAIIIFTITLLWEKWKENKEKGKGEV